MNRRGYFDIKTDSGETKTLHFSINAWFNLQEATGLDLVAFGAAMDKEYKKKKPDNVKILDMISELALAAAKAYCQEEDQPIDFNKFKMRAWLSTLNDDQMNDFMQAMLSSTSLQDNNAGK